MIKESLIDIEAKYFVIVQEILKRKIPLNVVWAYGSRVNGTAKKHSDLDLVVFGADNLLIGELKEDFAESDLPFNVDVMSWEKIPENFQNNIRNKYIVVQEKVE